MFQSKNQSSNVSIPYRDGLSSVLSYKGEAKEKSDFPGQGHPRCIEERKKPPAKSSVQLKADQENNQAYSEDN